MGSSSRRGSKRRPAPSSAPVSTSRRRKPSPTTRSHRRSACTTSRTSSPTRVTSHRRSSSPRRPVPSTATTDRRGTARRTRCSRSARRRRPPIGLARSSFAARSSAASRGSTTRGSTRVVRRCSASWPASKDGSTTPWLTWNARSRCRGAAATSRPRRISRRRWAGRNVRPATTRPARRAFASRSRRPRPSATCGWLHSRGCTSDEWSGRSVTTTPRTTRSCPRARRHRAAGGGEQALLGECLLAAMDGDVDRLQQILDESPEPHVAVFAPRRARALRRGRQADGARGTLHLRTRPGGPMNQFSDVLARWLERDVLPERDRARPRRRVPDRDGRADARVRPLRRHDPDRVRRARPLDVDLRRDRHADLRGVDVAHRRLELAPDDGAPHPHVRHRRSSATTSSRSSRRASCAAGSRSPSRRAAATCRRSARPHAATATPTSSTARRPGSRTAAAATASPCS